MDLKKNLLPNEFEKIFKNANIFFLIILHYFPLKEGVNLHFNNLEHPYMKLRNSLCQVCIKLV